MDSINVLYPFDNNYAPYAGVSLTSLLESNRDAQAIHVFVLGFDLTRETEDRFRRTVSNYGRDITFLDQKCVDDIIDTYNIPSYRGARVAISRLFVSLFMPDDIDRLLYLDSDTIVKDDITGLLHADLSGMPVGMVCDSVARDYKQYMGFTPEEPYFNGGMIVYDLNAWKEKRCTERIIDHIREVRMNYEALDQDLINIVLKGEIKKLDPRYNFQPFHCAYSPQKYVKAYGVEGYYDIDTIKEAQDHIVILHTFRYIGMFPWDKDSIHPCIKEYEQYKGLSLWRDMESSANTGLPLTLRIEKLLYRILPHGLFLAIFRFIFKTYMKKIDVDLKNDKQYRNM